VKDKFWSGVDVRVENIVRRFGWVGSRAGEGSDYSRD